MEINVKFEQKQGRNYIVTWESSDPMRVYEDLTHELIAKKVNACSYIRSIKRTPLYNGYQRITVTQDNGNRRVYTVKDH